MKGEPHELADRRKGVGSSRLEDIRPIRRPDEDWYLEKRALVIADLRIRSSLKVNALLVLKTPGKDHKDITMKRVIVNTGNEDPGKYDPGEVVEIRGINRAFAEEDSDEDRYIVIPVGLDNRDYTKEMLCDAGNALVAWMNKFGTLEQLADMTPKIQVLIDEIFDIAKYWNNKERRDGI